MFFFLTPCITWMYVFFPSSLPLNTGTTTIQPVHSGGCHGNRAASVSIFCPVSPLSFSASQAGGGLDDFCKWSPVIGLEARKWWMAFTRCKEVANSPHPEMALQISSGCRRKRTPNVELNFLAKDPYISV